MRSAEKTQNLFRRIVKIVQPPPEMTVSQWADQYRYLQPGATPEPGRWRTERVPYMREIMDCLSATSPVQDICLMKGAQVAGSESGNNWIGYIISMNPAPVMMVQPTVETAKGYSQRRIAPMIAACPELKNKIKDTRKRDSGNRTMAKVFPGGFLIITGANSAPALRSNPIQYLFLDEVDAYTDDVDGEGDPIKLALGRTRAFADRKIFKNSTPKIKGSSRIEEDFEQSDQRRYFVPCPHCGHMHVLYWDNVHIPKDEKGKYKPEDTFMVCPECGCKIEEYEKTNMLARGEWRSTAPENLHPKRRGYHLNALYSPLGFYSWAECAADWIEAQKSPKQMKVFINTILGETYEEDVGETLDHEMIIRRRETYNCMLPDGVLILTAGVDVQDDRLEIEVVGWGIGRESWGIEYRKFFGSPGENAVWEELDDYLLQEYECSDGTRLKIAITCIDSGGNHTQKVYEFTKRNERRKIFSIKGRGGAGVPFAATKYTRRNKFKAAVFTLGVDEGKENLWYRLKLDFPGPGYCHFPIEAERGYDEQYFKGLTSEYRCMERIKGRPKWSWKRKPGSTRRNEPLDIRNYAAAGLELLRPNLDKIAQIRFGRRKSAPVNRPGHAANSTSVAEILIKAQPKPRRRIKSRR